MRYLSIGLIEFLRSFEIFDGQWIIEIKKVRNSAADSSRWGTGSQSIWSKAPGFFRFWYTLKLKSTRNIHLPHKSLVTLRNKHFEINLNDSNLVYIHRLFKILHRVLELRWCHFSKGHSNWVIFKLFVEHRGDFFDNQYFSFLHIYLAINIRTYFVVFMEISN